MSGPKRYEFYASSDEEAEEIVARFAAFSHGVRAYVRDGEIVVEQARYDNTMSFSEIGAAVEKCRKKYREDERMRKLIAAEKERAAQEIRAAFDRARTAAAARVAEAKTELKRCETLAREISLASYSTPFGDFSMKSRTGALEAAMRDISSEIASAAAEKSRLDAAERAAVDAVYACDGLQAIERAERSGKAVSVPAPDASRRVDDIEEKLGEERDRLKAFVGFLRSLDGMAERKGMSGYRDRLKSVVEGTDPFAAGAADAVAAAFEKMCAEEAYVREGEKALRAERAAAAAGDEAARLSEEIAALLRPVRSTEEVFADIRRANEERSDALIGKCESLLAELDAMRYRPKDRSMHTERLRKTIERCKKTRNMTVTPDMVAQMGINPDYLQETFMMRYLSGTFVLGLGLGCMMSVVMSAVQNSSKPSEMGMTTSSVNLIRSIGTTMGTAIFTMIINGRITGELQSFVPDQLPQWVFDSIPHDTGVIGALADPSMIIYAPQIMTAFSNSVDFSFLAGGCIILILVIVGIFFKAQKPEEDPEFEAVKHKIESGED